MKFYVQRKIFRGFLVVTMLLAAHDIRSGKPDQDFCFEGLSDVFGVSSSSGKRNLSS